MASEASDVSKASKDSDPSKRPKKRATISVNDLNKCSRAKRVMRALVPSSSDDDGDGDGDGDDDEGNSSTSDEDKGDEDFHVVCTKEEHAHFSAPLGKCIICHEDINCPVTYCGNHWLCASCAADQYNAGAQVNQYFRRVGIVDLEMHQESRPRMTVGQCPECKVSIYGGLVQGIQGSMARILIPKMTNRVFNCPFKCRNGAGRNLPYLRVIHHFTQDYSNCNGFHARCQQCSQNIGVINPNQNRESIEREIQTHHQNHLAVCTSYKCPVDNCTFPGGGVDHVKTHYRNTHPRQALRMFCRTLRSAVVQPAVFTSILENPILLTSIHQGIQQLGLIVARHEAPIPAVPAVPAVPVPGPPPAPAPAP